MLIFSKKFYLIICLILLYYVVIKADIYRSESFIIKYKGIKTKYVKRFADILEKDVEDFQRKLGKYPEYKVLIEVASTPKEYLKIINPNQKIVEFSDAVYIPPKNMIVIKNPRYIINYSLIHRIVLHEYIHSFVHRFFYNPPLWFNEGMAVYFSSDFGFDRELRFVYSYLLENPLSLRQMTYRYPKNRAEWEFFYAKSALAVKYLYTSDKRKFIDFFGRAKPHSDFYKVFRLTYLQSINAFSARFEKYCKNNFKVMMITASSTLLWGLLPFIVLIVYFRKKHKYKKMYENGDDFEEV